MMNEEKTKKGRSKVALRSIFLQKRREFYAKHFGSKKFSLQELERLQTNLVQFVSCLLPAKARVCAIYWPHEGELDALVLTKHFSSLKWAFPRIEARELVFYIPPSLSYFKKNSFGLMEPDPSYSEKIPLALCQGVFVPALAYDRNCGRLGRGKGYYDRALKDYRGLKVGLAYAVQVDKEDLPMNEKTEEGLIDVRMDAVVTEKFFFQTWKNLNSLKSQGESLNYVEETGA